MGVMACKRFCGGGGGGGGGNYLNQYGSYGLQKILAAGVGGGG